MPTCGGQCPLLYVCEQSNVSIILTQSEAAGVYGAIMSVMQARGCTIALEYLFKCLWDCWRGPAQSLARSSSYSWTSRRKSLLVDIGVALYY